jgi:hypothetical protein
VGYRANTGSDGKHGSTSKALPLGIHENSALLLADVPKTHGLASRQVVAVLHPLSVIPDIGNRGSIRNERRTWIPDKGCRE